MFPEITKEMADDYSLRCQEKAEQAAKSGKIGEMIVPMTVYTKNGWVVADKDEQPRPETTLEGLGKLRTPFRVMGKVTAGNSSGLNDGAAGALLMSKDKAEELGIEPKMQSKAFAYAGVKPEIMGIGPIPATHKALSVAGLTIDDIGLIEMNEAFAVQAVAFMKEFGLQFPDDPRRMFTAARSPLDIRSPLRESDLPAISCMHLRRGLTVKYQGSQQCASA